MKILACVKQVPDSSDTMAITPEGSRVVPTAATVFRMNRYDEFALEEALLMKERIPGTEVHAVTVGPERAGSTLRRALETGADHGIHILTPEVAYLDPFAVASLIASWARTRDYDLILAGVMAEDDMEGQTGQLLAAILDLPCVTSVMEARVRPADNEIDLEREIEGGLRMSVLTRMPAVLTIQSGINTPRYPSLSHVLRARRQAFEVMAMDGPALPGPLSRCTGVRLPEISSQGVIIAGTPREKARELVRILHEHAFLA
ncbi:MAG TPA: electron transfer flavoprotein subunit beta/FixA family protein [Deltaproteobacteria bacterium]|nr:electron transfer flavoprotein subunit beta/FixA family protein [Deltaproteobacteria bacterium]HQI80256.1 electron transfer flavoprotein subunit beta/FixA family protein [Deltaproteobacteria bacterium]